MTDLRQLATQNHASIRFTPQANGQTTPHTQRFSLDGGRFLRSAETTARNKAQYQHLRQQLRQDPQLKQSEQAIDAAFAAIDEQVKHGAPLSSRVLSRALAAGDQFLAQQAAAQRNASQQLFNAAASQVSDPARFLPLLQQAGAQGFDDLASLPTGLREALTTTVLDALRTFIDAHDTPLHDMSPRDMNTLLNAAIETSLPALSATVSSHRTQPWQDSPRLFERLSPALAATLDSVRTFAHQRHNARLCASSGQVELATRHFDAIAQQQISAMSNKDVLKLMRNLQSTDAIAFRLALAQAAQQPGNVRAQDLLEALNAFEGHVLDAFLTRGGEAELQRPAPTHDLTAGQMLAIGGQVQRDFRAELQDQPEAFLSGHTAVRQVVDTQGATKLAQVNIDAVRLKQSIQSAPLTINFQSTMFERAQTKADGSTTHSFVRPDGTVNSEALKMKNIFELPSSVKGEDYLARRDVVETHQFPELARREAQHGFVAQDRPLYTAVNIGREQRGAATGYGDCFLVLKEEVRDRALFSPTDTFFSHAWSLTDDSTQAFMSELRGMLTAQPSKLSPELCQALLSDPAYLLALQDTLAAGIQLGVGGVGRDHTLQDWVAQNLNALTHPQSQEKLAIKLEDQAWLQAVAMRSFMHQDIQGATIEHIDRLFQHLNQDQLDKLKDVADDPLAINVGLADYIEAQVFGGIDLSHDVAELHFTSFTPERFRSADEHEQIANMQRVADSMGAKLVVNVIEFALEKSLDPNSPEGRAALEAADRFGPAPSNSITHAFPQTPAITSNPAHQATTAGGLNSFKAQQLDPILEVYRGHELNFDPESIHGREHIGRVLIYANVLANFYREHGVSVDSHALYTTCALHDAGREANGPDRWEGDSAQLAQNALQAQGISDPAYLQLAASCIQADGQHHSIEALILKSADSLDIIRVRGPEGFDPHYLAFMNGDLALGPGRHIQQDTALRDALIQEVAAFIDATGFTPPSQAAWLQARADVERLQLTMLEQSTGDTTALEAQLSTAVDQMRALQTAVHNERRAHTQQSGNLTEFAQLESVLLSDPQRFPLLNRYYDPSK